MNRGLGALAAIAFVGAWAMVCSTAAAQNLLDVGAAIFDWDSYNYGVTNRDDALVYKRQSFIGNRLGFSGVESEIYVQVVDNRACVLSIKQHVPADPKHRERAFAQTIRSTPIDTPTRPELEHIAKSTVETIIKLSSVYLDEAVVAQSPIGAEISLPGEDDLICRKQSQYGREFKGDQRLLKHSEEIECSKKISITIRNEDVDRFKSMLKRTYSEFCSSSKRGKTGRF